MSYLSICENAPNSQLGASEGKNSQLGKFEAVLIGKGYRAGAATDQAIAAQLGKAATYHADLPSTLDALAARFQAPWLVPMVGGMHACIFEVDGAVAVTVAQPTEAAAAACALHFLACCDKSALT